jgi:KipI family sensor histidine kinase inhibitor
MKRADAELFVKPYGPHAVLVTFASEVGEAAFDRGRALMATLETNPPPGLAEIVPAFTTLLLEFEADKEFDLEAVTKMLHERFSKMDHAALPAAVPKEIPVIYDGVDLSRVAEWNRLSPAEVIELHSATVYRVYMLGFSPGFPYLGDLSERLHTPRLDTPRPRVAAGSVAIGGEHTGIYSVDSPGGWNIIGRVLTPIFSPEFAANDPARSFLLKAGDQVRFVPRKSA